MEFHRAGLSRPGLDADWERRGVGSSEAGGAEPSRAVARDILLGVVGVLGEFGAGDPTVNEMGVPAVAPSTLMVTV